MVPETPAIDGTRITGKRDGVLIDWYADQLASDGNRVQKNPDGKAAGATPARRLPGSLNQRPDEKILR
jgi:hypothetical protein